MERTSRTTRLDSHESASSAIDRLGRPLLSLRISVTDRCNLRCSYCMPEDEYAWIPRDDILTFEEINALVDVFVRQGVEKIRLTGGEPLLRRVLMVQNLWSLRNCSSSGVIVGLLFLQ